MRVKKKFVLRIILVIGLLCILRITWNNYHNLKSHELHNKQQNPQELLDLRHSNSKAPLPQHPVTARIVHFLPKTRLGDCPPVNWSYPRYCIRVDPQRSMIGDRFNVSISSLKALGMPLEKFEPLNRSELDDFVLVTAADARYMPNAMDAIANVQHFLPHHKIYFYDLGIPVSQIEKVQLLCSVIYRRFNYSRYPAHVKHLKNYSFKPLIIQEMLVTFSRIFWMDSSIRWNTGDLALTLNEVFASGGIIIFEPSRRNRNNFQTTHPNMYRYLPIPVPGAVGTLQFGANSIYIHANAQIYNQIIVWWVLCALIEDCIAPTLVHKCRFTGNDAWAGCHRFDQSSLNILLANHFQYDVQRYASKSGQLDVLRGSANKEKVLICSKNLALNSSDHLF